MNEGVIKAVCVALVALLAGLLLKRMREELSVGVRIGAIVLIFVIVIGGVREIFTSVDELLVEASFEGYAEPMLRAVGISFLCKICSDICRDCGEIGLASGVENAGKIGILLLSVPMIRELLKIAAELWETGSG